MVDLIDNKNDGLLATAKHIGNFLICRSDARSSVNYKDYDICGLNGKLCLTAHLLCNDIFALRLDSACID